MLYYSIGGIGIHGRVVKNIVIAILKTKRCDNNRGCCDNVGG